MSTSHARDAVRLQDGARHQTVRLRVQTARPVAVSRGHAHPGRVLLRREQLGAEEHLPACGAHLVGESAADPDAVDDPRRLATTSLPVTRTSTWCRVAKSTLLRDLATAVVALRLSGA
ncbi:MAG: hypothetical protein B7X41_11445 [Microbacterium sp. 14-71-5]|nr:MAG: hypothetical protein B7X41_11445 [Microbacterium sp. 14-71-5]